MECLAKCLEGASSSEFGPNISAWSPLTLSEIRSRQQSNTDGPKTYKIGHPSKAPITLRYGWVCQRGLYPDDPDKENQDAFKIIPSFDGEERTILMGVFDGHGEYGDDCSYFVRDNIESYLSQARQDFGKDLEKSFRSAFRKLNSDMHFQKVSLTLFWRVQAPVPAADLARVVGRLRRVCVRALSLDGPAVTVPSPSPAPPRSPQDFSDQLSGTTAVVAYFEKSAVWVRNQPRRGAGLLPALPSGTPCHASRHSLRRAIATCRSLPPRPCAALHVYPGWLSAGAPVRGGIPMNVNKSRPFGHVRHGLANE